MMHSNPAKEALTATGWQIATHKLKKKKVSEEVSDYVSTELDRPS